MRTLSKVRWSDLRPDDFLKRQSACPIVYMPIVAVTVRWLSIAHVMIGASVVMLVGLGVAMRLVEPREHPPIAPEEVPPLPVGDAGA